MRDVPQAIEAFKKRLETERDWCEQLFENHYVRIMAHKYLYYVHSTQIVEDITYDGEEKSWYIMGVALGRVKEEDHTPCVDFDEKNPYAEKGRKLGDEWLARGLNKKF